MTEVQSLKALLKTVKEEEESDDFVELEGRAVE